MFFPQLLYMQITLSPSADFLALLGKEQILLSCSSPNYCICRSHLHHLPIFVYCPGENRFYCHVLSPTWSCRVSVFLPFSIPLLLCLSSFLLFHSFFVSLPFSFLEMVMSGYEFWLFLSFCLFIFFLNLYFSFLCYFSLVLFLSRPVTFFFPLSHNIHTQKYSGLTAGC